MNDNIHDASNKLMGFILLAEILGNSRRMFDIPCGGSSRKSINGEHIRCVRCGASPNQAILAHESTKKINGIKVREKYYICKSCEELK